MSLCDSCFFNLRVSKQCSKKATIYPLAQTCPAYQKDKSANKQEEPRIKRIMNTGGTVVNFYSDMVRL